MTPQETIPDWIRTELDDIREAAGEIGGLVKDRLDSLLDDVGAPPQPKIWLRVWQGRTVTIADTEYSTGKYQLSLDPSGCIEIKNESGEELQCCVGDVHDLKRVRVVAPAAPSTDVFVLAQYKGGPQLVPENYTCVQCNGTVICGVNPSCGPGTD